MSRADIALGYLNRSVIGMTAVVKQTGERRRITGYGMRAYGEHVYLEGGLILKREKVEIVGWPA